MNRQFRDPRHYFPRQTVDDDEESQLSLVSSVPTSTNNYYCPVYRAGPLHQDFDVQQEPPSFAYREQDDDIESQLASSERKTDTPFGNQELKMMRTRFPWGPSTPRAAREGLVETQICEVIQLYRSNSLTLRLSPILCLRTLLANEIYSFPSPNNLIHVTCELSTMPLFDEF